MSDWCTIESDPGVFTSLIESFGVVNAQLTELYSLDDDSLRSLLDSYGVVHGLVFLFKWQSDSNDGNDGSGGSNSGSGNSDANKPQPLMEGAPEDLFFARQVTTNACATQAILSILLNANNTNTNTNSDTNSDTNTNNGSDTNNSDNSHKLELGETLSNLQQFTQSFPADLKGESIGASEEIRSAHNSFARKEAFWMGDGSKRVATKDDDVFHFVAYGEFSLV